MTQTAANRRERRKQERNIAKDVAHHRARVAGLARGVRSPDDPELVEARRAMFRAQQTVAAHAVLDSTEARVSGDPDRMTEILRSAGVPVAVMLLESVELLAYVVSLSDRPSEVLSALRGRVDGASTD
ncbi:hypothetical protein ACTWP6_29935 [Mycobacterium sp. 4D054]|uniref:hypothetical protein n=1 Tax=Mycobacterium sp. 4D054 TaxID=3457440 RepID=UPI003FD6BECE